MAEIAFERINRDHVLSALEEIDRMGVRPGRESVKYDLMHNGKAYPPKYVMSLAFKYATGEELDATLFSGGEDSETHLTLEKLDFRIVVKAAVAMSPERFIKELTKYLKTFAVDASVSSAWTFSGREYVHLDALSVNENPLSYVFKSRPISLAICAIDRKISDSCYLIAQPRKDFATDNIIDLSRSGNFVNTRGTILIKEDFEMIGIRRHSKNILKRAYHSLGFVNNVITSFHENEPDWNRILLDILRWGEISHTAIDLLDKGVPLVSKSLTRYWIFPINGRNWNLLHMQPGQDGFYNYYSETDDPNLALLMRNLRVGDKVFAFDFSLHKGLVFSAEITQPLHSSQYGEVFTFRVTRLIQPAIPIDFLKANLAFLKADDFLWKDKLYSISSVEYDLLDKMINGSESAGSQRALAVSQVFNDGVDDDLKDNLDILNDVNAIASVISYRSVQPPLAIGLFGHWGMGKSFFMNKLKKRIDELSIDSSELFCKNILQIKFNSWHYSDANLWASLVTKIFEELEKFGKKEPGDVEALFVQLSSTQKILEEKQEEKRLIELELSELEQQKVVFETEKEEKSQRLDRLSAKEVFKTFFQGSDIQDDINSVKKEYKFLKIDGADEAQEHLRELTDIWSKGKDVWAIISKLKGQRSLWVLIIGVVFSGAVWLLLNNSLLIENWFVKHKTLFTSLLLLFSQGMLTLQPAIKRFLQFYGWLKKINGRIETMRQLSATKFEGDQKNLQDEVDQVKSKLAEVKQKIALENIQRDSLQIEIGEIKSGTKIRKFIEERVTDQRYINSLGIISWIRKDLEQLDKLLVQQRRAKELTENDDTEVAHFKLERIVLYIDDLDRCSEEVVVKVLEAIHLLLAFPLFVVVVGVDPRWMHAALESHYAKFLKLASSGDYLEKIFQIPFALKSMNAEGKSSLIRAQLHNVQHEEITAPAVDKEAIGVSDGGLNNNTEEHWTVGENDVVHAEVLEPGTAATMASPIADIVKPESLIISNAEIEFIESIADMIGDSPRTLKRYTNIYRIIRTHASLSIKESETFEYHVAAIILLAVTTGVAQSVELFFTEILAAPDNKSFLSFVEEKIEPNNDSAAIGLGVLRATATTERRRRLFEHMKMYQFKENIPLVKRFSYQHGYKDKELEGKKADKTKG